MCRDTSVLYPRQNAKLAQSDSYHYSSRESELLRSSGKFENVELKQGEVNPRQRRHFTLLCLNLTCSLEFVPYVNPFTVPLFHKALRNGLPFKNSNL